MASERSVLGVPTIFVSSVGQGYTDEQEALYGLCVTTQDEDLAIGKALDWLSDSSPKAHQEMASNHVAAMQDAFAGVLVFSERED